MVEHIPFQVPSERRVDVLMRDEKIERYLSSLESFSSSTYGHSVSTAILAEQIAKYLKLKNIDEIVTGALLHDIGKIFVPDEILNKPSKLTEGEFDNIKLHPLNGLFYIMDDFSEEVDRIVRDHHEKLDGSGYFYGRRDLTLGTQIVTVCDMYDAMTKREIYKERYTRKESLLLLYKDAELGKLNPDIVDALSAVTRRRVIHGKKARE